MLKNRRGEKKRVNAERTHRFFQTNEGWFLRTREGIPIGPYETEFDVELAASLLSPILAELAKEGRHAEVITTIRSFLSDPLHGPNKKQDPIGATADFEDSLERYPPVIQQALKRGYTDFVEQSVHIAHLMRIRITKKTSIRKSG